MTGTMHAKHDTNCGKIDRYRAVLRHIPPPGCGCHTSLLGVANHGAIAGTPPREIFEDIRRNIPPGSRRISDREIREAINKALADHNGGTFVSQPRPVPVVQNGTAALQHIINQGRYSDEADVWEASPIRLLDEPDHDPALFLAALYEPKDLIWIGRRHQAGIMGDTVRTRDEWIIHYRNGGTSSPHIILNPLSGKAAPTKNGDGTTLRGDSNVLSYRYCLAEFDTVPREDQIRFWSAARLPVVALIDSGGKSLHAWLRIAKLAAVTTAEDWQTHIKGRVYDRLLTPLGVDGACSNPARLSRLPGHFREEKGAWQRLLWLSPEGRYIR